MAIQTKVIANHLDAASVDPVVVFSFTYDDVDLRVRSFRCDNRSGDLPEGHPFKSTRAWGKAELADGTRSREGFFDPNPVGQPTVITVPTTVAQRLQLVVNAKGTLDGVSFSSIWPA
jgi:hypothetical protein